MRSLFLSALLVHFEGRVISKAPKKLAANTMNTRKKIIFGSQWVASQLNMSAVTPLPPTSQVTPIMAEMGTVYSRTMNSPYIMALKRPAAGEPLPFMKKEIVIGTIGNTHGVNSMANPHSIASRISPQSEDPAEGPSAAPESSAADTEVSETGAPALCMPKAPGSGSAGGVAADAGTDVPAESPSPWR